MNNNLTLSIQVKPVWSIISEIRDKAENFFIQQKLNDNFIDDSLMCITELVENAVKYGSEEQEDSNIDFNLSVNADTIVITVSNRVTNENHLNNFIAGIHEIHKTKDLAQLYIDKLMKILESNEGERIPLGLCRICHESLFSLTYSYDQNTHIISITASRQT